MKTGVILRGFEMAEKTPDELVARFAERAAKKATPREVRIRKQYPPIGMQFAVDFPGENGEVVQAVLKLTYVNEGKGRLVFEYV